MRKQMNQVKDQTLNRTLYRELSLLLFCSQIRDSFGSNIFAGGSKISFPIHCTV